MKMVAAAFLAANLALSVSAQEERRSVHDVLKEHGPAIRGMDGVLDVSAGGSAEEPRIMIRVSGDEARAAVRTKCGATVGGYKIFVYVSTQVDPKPEPPKPPVDPPAPSPPPTKSDPERDSLEDCDIMRDHLKLKAITRHKDSKTIDPCQLLRRQRVGGGGGHTFWYTRHRSDCPIRSGRVRKPGKADDFTEWVFTRGFLPVRQGSFLVFELKASDNLWFEGVKEDLTSLLPFIREGARWVSAKEEDAGKDWKWEVPK